MVVGLAVGGFGGEGHVCHQGTPGGAPKRPSCRVGEDKATTPHADTELGDSMEGRTPDCREAVWGSGQWQGWIPQLLCNCTSP